MLNCDVYIAHYSPLTDRLDFMSAQMQHFGIDFKIIDEEPPNGWIIDDIDARRKKLDCFNGDSSRPMSLAETSLAWKHFNFIKNAANSSRPSLVLEDDALLSANFVEIVNKILEIKEWDVIFPGSGCNLRRQGSGLIRVQHPASKCTDSYLLTPDSAKKLYTTMQERIDIAIDWELSYQMMIHDLKVFWLEPPIVMQLSQNGTFQSAINGKKEDLYGGKEYVRFRSI